MSAPEDRAEQDIPVGRDAAPQVQPDVPLEVDAADAAEQSAVVELDEDEHR